MNILHTAIFLSPNILDIRSQSRDSVYILWDKRDYDIPAELPAGPRILAAFINLITVPDSAVIKTLKGSFQEGIAP